MPKYKAATYNSEKKCMEEFTYILGTHELKYVINMLMLDLYPKRNKYEYLPNIYAQRAITKLTDLLEFLDFDDDINCFQHMLVDFYNFFSKGNKVNRKRNCYFLEHEEAQVVFFAALVYTNKVFLKKEPIFGDKLFEESINDYSILFYEQFLTSIEEAKNIVTEIRECFFDTKEVYMGNDIFIPQNNIDDTLKERVSKKYMMIEKQLAEDLEKETELLIEELWPAINNCIVQKYNFDYTLTRTELELKKLLKDIQFMDYHDKVIILDPLKNLLADLKKRVIFVESGKSTDVELYLKDIENNSVDDAFIKKLVNRKNTQS